MQSTNIRQINAALRDQAFPGTTQVRCPVGPVESVRIESSWPQLLQEGA